MESIAIFRDRLLPASEGFILSQAESMKRYSPIYVGCKRTDELETPRSRTLLSGSCFNEVMFKLSGRAPGLQGALRERHPVLIHAHFGPDAVVAMPLARHLHIPLVVTFHGYDATTADRHLRASYTQRKYVRRRAQLADEAARIIAVSGFIAKRLRERGFSSSKIIVHHIGVDLKTFSVSSAEQRKAIVLFVGRLVDVKGCEIAIRAMSRLQRIIPSVKLVIVGDGPLRSSLEALAASEGVNASFEGTKSPSVVRRWMAMSRVLCAPSVTTVAGDQEGMGLAVIEAQAMGLPVVASRSGGLPEAVEHGTTGFLEREGDFEGMAQSLEGLLRDQVTWNQFSNAARARAERLFNLDHQTSKLEDLYDEVLQS